MEAGSGEVPEVRACPVWLQPGDRWGGSAGCEVRGNTEDQFVEVIMKVLVFMLSENRKPLMILNKERCDLTIYFKKINILGAESWEQGPWLGYYNNSSKR